MRSPMTLEQIKEELLRVCDNATLEAANLQLTRKEMLQLTKIVNKVAHLIVRLEQRAKEAGVDEVQHDLFRFLASSTTTIFDARRSVA